MGTRIVTGPAQEPVSLEETKSHLRVEHSGDDYVIQSLIIAATGWAESFTHRRFITQTWDWTIDEFPEDDLHLIVPFGSLQSVASFSYVDANGAAASLDGSPSNYLVDIGDPGRIALSYGVSWPSLRGDPNGVTIRFTAGYGLAAAVPRVIKVGILLYVEALYERDPKTMEMLKSAAEAVLLPHRIYSVV